MIGILVGLHAFILGLVGSHALRGFISSSLDGVRYWFLVAAYSKPIAGSMLLSLKPSLDGGSM